MRRLIVGIDPGTTAAVAVLSLSGRLVSITSKKDFSKEEIIKYIMLFGSPTIVATDKSSPPKIVEKINANFDSVLYSPKEDLQQREKLEMTKNYNLKNSHQRDALAAAFSAYLEYSDTLRKIDKILNELYLLKYKDRVKDLIIKGKVNNIANAVKKIIKEEKANESKGRKT